MQHDARIVRDGYGVPHVFGKTDADTAYGLAYAHAEDDFTTIQDVLAMTRGRAGALIGADAAKADYVLHLIGARETAARDYPGLPADVRAMLDGYARGLNFYAAHHSSEVRMRRLFPVNGEDVLTGFVLRSPFFFGLDDTLGALMEGKPLPWTGGVSPLGKEPSKNGSNAFALAPSKMADGQTTLISNSHQPYEGGVAWYEASVHSAEGLAMSGALFPGSPFVLLGHNRDLGWTNTVNRPDLIDIYRLTLNEDGDAYRFDGQWLPLQSKRIWMKLRFGPFVLPWPMSVQKSRHGPVVSTDHGTFAIRYAGIERSGMVEQYYRIGKARDWDEWQKAMEIGGVPATNFIYADKSGRIAYLYYALFPDRAEGFDWKGILPGDTSKALWSGYLPFSAVPKVVNPKSGFVQNANHNPFMTAGAGSELDPAAFPARMGIEMSVTNRGLRAVELLSAEGVLSEARLLAIKNDMRYSPKSFVGPWFARIAALDLKAEPELAKAQALLGTWDWTSDGKGRADALAEYLIHAAAKSNWRQVPMPDAKEELAKAVAELSEHFGRIDPPYAEVQRLRRGDVDLAMDGGNDTLRCATSWDAQDDGRKRVKHGDSFIQIARWDSQGRVRAVSIQPYGAATNRPDSPHYTDQMKLFVEKRFKPAPFTRREVIAESARAYRIGNAL